MFSLQSNTLQSSVGLFSAGRTMLVTLALLGYTGSAFAGGFWGDSTDPEPTQTCPEGYHEEGVGEDGEAPLCLPEEAPGTPSDDPAPDGSLADI